ncbi:AAA family ATPase [Macrococcoides canis]|uniref:AAA family ATPase n=1 Tax=Macrococcoides canis TaxID=1855823 RepID=UPI00105CDA48|nr:AAA family ATPase [Macrococcus canis]TDM21196.1 AAA family ATPase [Macrococcus canis]TDM23963.1 AAA family ATPase [Macrococcus canis]
MKKLIIYNRLNYNYLKKKYLENNIETISYSDTIGENPRISLNSIEIENYLIDISNINFDIWIDNGSFFGFETSILQSPFNLNFIIDEKYIEDSYLFRNIFNSIEVFETDYSTTLEKHIESREKRLITQLNNEELNKFFQKFNDSIIGHSNFKSRLNKKIKEFMLFNKIDENKIFSIFIMGDSGVGKTEVAKSVYKALNGNDTMVKINFGNYSNENSLTSLIGSPRGYMGSENGELFDKINTSNYGVILIDEFEKSNNYLFNYFLDMLESGTATNSLGDEYNLNGYIVIFTSNVNSNSYESVFPPELRSRFDMVVKFQPLNKQEKQLYCQKRIKSIFNKINENTDLNIDNGQVFNIISQIELDHFNNMRYLNNKIKSLITDYVNNMDSAKNVPNESENL